MTNTTPSGLDTILAKEGKVTIEVLACNKREIHVINQKSYTKQCQ